MTYLSDKFAVIIFVVNIWMKILENLLIKPQFKMANYNNYIFNCLLCNIDNIFLCFMDK